MKTYGIVEDEVKFIGRIMLIGVAFSQHKVSFAKKDFLSNDATNSAKLYLKYCNNLSSDIFKKYENDLENRLSKGFPEIATVIPVQKNVSPSPKDKLDLMAYDAYRMYLAKKNKKDFFIDNEGKLIFEEYEEFYDNNLSQNEKELKSIDDEYYSD